MIPFDISAALNSGRGFFQSPWCYFHLFIAIDSNSIVPMQPGEVMFRLTLTTSIIPLVPSFALSPIHSSNQILISKEHIYSPLKLPLDVMRKKAWSLKATFVLELLPVQLMCTAPWFPSCQLYLCCRLTEAGAAFALHIFMQQLRQRALVHYSGSYSASKL